MSEEKDIQGDSCHRDAQLDLFTLIGGSWPPAPCEPVNSEYRTTPLLRRHTMQRPSQNERIKSVNLIEHLVPDRRRNKQATAANVPNVTDNSPQKNKMVLEKKKIETGILVDVCNSDSSQGLLSSTLGSPHTSSQNSRHSPIGQNQENIGVGARTAADVDQLSNEVRWIDVRCADNSEEVYDSPVLGSPRAATFPSRPSPLGHTQDDIGVGSLVEVATDVDQHHYGVVRWIGIIDETATAGVELEQSVCGLGDGVRGGARLFACAPGRALFVPLPLCRRDARFRDTPPPGRAPPSHPAGDQVRYIVVILFVPLFSGKMDKL